MLESTVIVCDSSDCLEKARKMYLLSDLYTVIQLLILLSLLGKITFIPKNYEGTVTYKKNIVSSSCISYCLWVAQEVLCNCDQMKTSWIF